MDVKPERFRIKRWKEPVVQLGSATAGVYKPDELG